MIAGRRRGQSGEVGRKQRDRVAMLLGLDLDVNKLMGSLSESRSSLPGSGSQWLGRGNY